jgi:hypothetical protein
MFREREYGREALYPANRTLFLLFCGSPLGLMFPDRETGWHSF